MDESRFQTAITATPVKFTGWSGQSVHTKYALKDGDIVLQVMPRKKFPDFPGERIAKALADVLGVSALESIQIEVIDSQFIEGGTSAFVRCTGMGSPVQESILFPKVCLLLDEYMQAP